MFNDEINASDRFYAGVFFLQGSRLMQNYEDFEVWVRIKSNSENSFEIRNKNEC